MSNLLINCRPLIVLPPLVKLFDGNYTKALVVQQLHFMLNNPAIGVEHDGERWVWFTYQDWADELFIWMSADTLGNVVRELEKEGYIMSQTRLKDKWDNTKFYRLNYAKFDPNVGVRVEANADVGVEPNADSRVIYNDSKTSPKTSSSSSSKSDDDEDEIVSLTPEQTRTITELMHRAGSPITAYWLDSIALMVRDYGFEAVLRGVETAANNAKQTSMRYIEACARNASQGATTPAKKQVDDSGKRSAMLTRARLAQQNLATARKFGGQIDPQWEQDIELARKEGLL